MQSSIHHLRPRSNKFLLQLAPDNLFWDTVNEVLLRLEHFLKVILFVLDVLLLILFLHPHGRFDLVPFGINDRLGNAIHMIDIVFWKLVTIWTIVLLFRNYLSVQFVDHFSVISSGRIDLFGLPRVGFNLVAEDPRSFLISFLNIMGSRIILVV